MGKFVRKAVDAIGGRPSAGVPDDSGFAAAYPAVWEYLTEREWEKGKKRETSTLTFFVDEDEWKIAFNDRGNQRAAFITASSFTEVLAALEQGLQEDSLDWRKSRGEKNRDGR